MDWDRLRIFHAVAKAGSLTHAGESLHLSQSGVSRQITQLEESLKVSLFHRHARGLILTEQGELLIKAVDEIYNKLAETEARLSEDRKTPEGPLRINTTISFGSLWLTPLIGDFIECYPDIQLSLLLHDHELDLSMREADVAIRMGAPKQSDLIQRPLMNLHFSICASQHYLARFGIPKSIEDLNRHRIIIYGDEAHAPVLTVNWLINAGLETNHHHRQPVLKVNNIYAMFLAVQSGLGIAALPNYLLKGKHELIEILPELRGPTVTAYFVYPEELRHSKRISVFRDFLLQHIAD
jgi:DNA-binding transcriptional LysR family regulator